MHISKANSDWRKLAFWLGWIGCIVTQSLVHREVVASAVNAIHRDGIVTFPLIPHHVQRRRRELETGRDLQSGARQPPSHYPRFLDVLSNSFEPLEEEGANASTTTTNNNIDDLASAAQQVAALFQGYGTHYADLWCGTPPQRQTVIVDTGSAVTAFPCSRCQDCGVPDFHIDQLFSEKSSSTFVKVQCDECLAGSCEPSQNYCSMGASYAEGSSWYAYEAQDVCYLGGLHNTPEVDNQDNNREDPFHAPAFAFDLKFGCQHTITGLFQTQLADGIMGMDMVDGAFWKQMYHAERISRSAFSLCFGRSDIVAREGTVAGAMSLGGTDSHLHKTPMVYTSGVDGSGFYQVQIRKAYLREGPSGNSATNLLEKKIVRLDVLEDEFGEVIVDSGTTETYFLQAFGTHFTEAFHKMTGKTYSNKERTITPDEVYQYPTILFQLYGDKDRNEAVIQEFNGGAVTGLAGSLDPEHPYDVILAIPPSHYFDYDKEQGIGAPRFYVDEYMDRSILGANSIMGHDVLFDIENGVLGWAESDCDYSGLVKKFFAGVNGTLADDPIVKPPKYNDCSSVGCQFCRGIVLACCGVYVFLRLAPWVGITQLFGYRLPRVFVLRILGWGLPPRSSSGQTYELTAVEVEMQTPPRVVRPIT